MHNQNETNGNLQTGDGIIVIQPGSFTLRFGIVDADDLKPHYMTNCIAIRKESKLKNEMNGNQNLESNKDEQTMTVENNSDVITTEATNVENTSSSPQVTQKAPKTRFTLLNGKSMQKRLSKIDLEIEEIKNMYDLKPLENDQVKLDENNLVEVLEKDNVEWIDIESSPEFVIGDDALYLDESDPYDIFFPFKYGHLNRSKGYSDAIILDMIHQIWEYALVNHVGINVDEFNEYNVVLIIPDSYSKSDVKELIDILICRMNFNAVYIQKESVCVAIGTGQQSCCVVNIGFSHTTIACVEDCEVLEGSSFSMAYGGIDISKCLLYLLNKNSKETHFRYYKADIDNSVQDLIIFEEMKESVCHLSFKNIKRKLYEFCERHRDQKTKLYRVSIGNEQVIAPLSLFHHGLLNTSTRIEIIDNDYSDPFEEYFAPSFIKEKESIPIRRAKISQKKMMVKESMKEAEVEDETTENTTPNINIRLFIPDYLIDKFAISPLHIAVVDSISSVSQKRVRQKFYNHVILAGGGSMIEGLREFLEEAVFSYAPGEVEKVEVSTIQSLGTPQSIA